MAVLIPVRSSQPWRGAVDSDEVTMWRIQPALAVCPVCGSLTRILLGPK